MILNKDKNIVVNKNITYFLNPDYIYVPASKIYVKEKDYIYKNEVVADTNTSSVSGVVLGVKKCNVMGGRKSCIVIQNDYREYFKEKGKKLKLSIINMLKLLENDKVLFDKFKSSKSFDNIVVYAIDDNPYLYNEVFLLKENINDVLYFYDKLLNLYKCRNNMLVLKNTEKNIIDDCLNVIGSYPEINLSLVNDEYLLSRPAFLNKYLNLKKNTLYLKVSELIKIYNLFKNVVSTTKLITISGDATGESKVIRIKINTSLKDVINKYIDIKNENYECIINGLMTGFKIDDIDNFILTKDVDVVNIMVKKEVITNACIRCARCINICPCGVNIKAKKNMEKCIDCGLCSYVCPCYINLKERIK